MGAKTHIRDRQRIGAFTRGLDDLVLKRLFGFDEDGERFRCFRLTYGGLYGEKALRWFLLNLPAYKAGKVTMSGMVAARMIYIVPASLTPAEAEELLSEWRKLKRRPRPPSRLSLDQMVRICEGDEKLARAVWAAVRAGRLCQLEGGAPPGEAPVSEGEAPPPRESTKVDLPSDIHIVRKPIKPTPSNLTAEQEVALIVREGEDLCQQVAVRYFPDLGVEGSALNLRFLSLYHSRKAANPAFFDRPDWPVRLAQEAHAGLSEPALATQTGRPQTAIPQTPLESKVPGTTTSDAPKKATGCILLVVLLAAGVVVLLAIVGGAGGGSSSGAAYSAPAMSTAAQRSNPTVWLNTRTGIYHYEGAEWYKNTRQGKLVPESEAIAEGARPSKTGN